MSDKSKMVISPIISTCSKRTKQIKNIVIKNIVLTCFYNLFISLNTFTDAYIQFYKNLIKKGFANKNFVINIIAPRKCLCVHA